MAKTPTSARRRPGRPRNVERETTVLTGSQIISWALPGGKGDTWELLSHDELLTRKGWRVYREMRNDDQIKACLWFKKTLITGRAWDLKPASDDAEDKKIAEFVAYVLRRVDLKKILKGALTAFDYGYSVGEILWEIVDELPKSVEAPAGPKMVLKDIKFRDPEFWVIKVDKHGNIISFVQRPIEMPNEEVNLAPEKTFHYAYQGELDNHYGLSDLRAVYAAWWSKKYIRQFFNVFLERFGAPMMMMKYPQGSSGELKTALKSIMDSLSSKTDILVPEGVVIELIEATRAGTAKYEEALVHYDVRIATGMLVPALLGMGADVQRGSDSQSRLHLRTLMKVIQDIGEEISTIIGKKIIEPMVDANFNDVKEYPKFMFQDYGEFEAMEITDAIKELHNAGVLELDQEDVNYARSILGLPVRDEDNEDSVERPEQAPMAGLGGGPAAGGSTGGATQGNKRAKKPLSSRKTNPRTGKRPS